MEQASSDSATKPTEIRAGDVVEVRTRYQAEQWARGYAIAEVLPGGVRVSRRGSGEILAEVFSSTDVRRSGDPS
jgi:hypothetical protein